MLRVRDTGWAWPREMLERVFEPFVQAEHDARPQQGGLGLGLALVKGLVELHGGAVEAHSEGLGKGAEFTSACRSRSARRSSARACALPSRRPAGEARAGDRGQRRRRREPAEVLELDGHEVEVAYAGPRASSRRAGCNPDVVLCDIGLPGMDGYEVARALRADPALAGITLVALSGYALPEDIERSREAGFDRHLAKPVEPKDLADI